MGSLTQKERLRLRKLELENSQLRAALEKAQEAYRNTLYELIDYRTQLEMIKEIAKTQGP